MKSEQCFFIEWIDSRSSFTGWMPSEDWNPQLIKIQTVGWIVFEDSDMISLSGNRYGGNEADTLHFNGAITIPKKCILRRVPISSFSYQDWNENNL